VLSTPVVDAHGFLYFGEGHSVASIDSEGRERWRWDAAGMLDPRAGTPVLMPDGGLAVGTRGKVVRLDSRGSVQWAFEGQDPLALFARPVPARDGSLYAIAGESVVYGLSSAGHETWSLDMRHPIAMLRVDEGGLVYLSVAGKIFVHDARGERRWTYGAAQAGDGRASVTFGSDGTVYASSERWLAALGSDGTLKWKVESVPGDVTCAASGITFGPDGILYFACGSRVFAYTSSGERKWAVTLGPGPVAVNKPPALAPDGTVYISGFALWALAPDGSTKWHLWPTLESPHSRPPDDVRRNPVQSAPWVGPDGTVYFGCAQNRVYAVAPDGRTRWVYKVGPDDSHVKFVERLYPLDGLLVASAGELIALPVRDARLHPMNLVGEPK
jgi:outer membrane protein assembly factor BamB